MDRAEANQARESPLTPRDGAVLSTRGNEPNYRRSRSDGWPAVHPRDAGHRRMRRIYEALLRETGGTDD